MNWVKARAYDNGQFLLERLLSQVASDIHEANRLPADARRHRRFHIERQAERFSVYCSAAGDTFDIATFSAQSKRVYVTGVLHGDHYAWMLSAQWDASAMEERWHVRPALGQGDFDQPRSISEACREILERLMFD